jgi:hypothetical protein
MKKVNLKLALALKAAKIHVDTFQYYELEDDGLWILRCYLPVRGMPPFKKYVYKPTYDQVCHYLREKKHTYVSVYYGYGKWSYSIDNTSTNTTIVTNLIPHKTFYAAQLAAIKHALKLLS